MPTHTATTALELLDVAIADLEAKIHLSPGCDPLTKNNAATGDNGDKKQQQQKQQQQQKKPKPKSNNNNNNGGGKNAAAAAAADQPAICKLEFKVGIITKAWAHPDADRLYCEEIDCGEESPRLIASGLRLHYTVEEMQGQRLLVVANLKAKNLVGFKSHGMVLCASETDATTGVEHVEFIAPPVDAPLGEIVTFSGLPAPNPMSPSQVEKKKVFAACMAGMKTNEEGVATWEGHTFVTSAGACKSRSIKNGVMR